MGVARPSRPGRLGPGEPGQDSTPFALQKLGSPTTFVAPRILNRRCIVMSAFSNRRQCATSCGDAAAAMKFEPAWRRILSRRAGTRPVPAARGRATLRGIPDPSQRMHRDVMNCRTAGTRPRLRSSEVELIADSESTFALTLTLSQGAQVFTHRILGRPQTFSLPPSWGRAGVGGRMSIDARHPHPNLPPSRGKESVSATRVLTCVDTCAQGERE